MKVFVVTGTKHGSIVEAPSEGAARRAFHKYYNGESIICMKCMKGEFMTSLPDSFLTENKYRTFRSLNSHL